jgi:ketosteroid isomerase-like protein
MNILTKTMICCFLMPSTIVISAESDNQLKYKSEIHQATIKWVDTYNRNDWNELAQQFSENAVMMPPNSPAVTGRQAIAAWETANETGFRIALKPDDITLKGDMAIIRGRSCVFIPMSNEENSNAIGVDIGKYMEVRERSDNGKWLILKDIFNSDLPAGSPLASECPSEISGQ